MLIIMLVAFGLIFYFMLIRPQRKRQQEMNSLLSGLKRGDKVMTAGGIIGEIDSIGDTSVVLTLEEGAKLRLAKMSIVRKIDK
jgi:preprotein translocase subunit YajC